MASAEKSEVGYEETEMVCSLEIESVGPVLHNTQTFAALFVVCVFTQNHRMAGERIRKECEMLLHRKVLVKHLDHFFLDLRYYLPCARSIETAEVCHNWPNKSSRRRNTRPVRCRVQVRIEAKLATGHSVTNIGSWVDAELSLECRVPKSSRRARARGEASGE